MEVVCVAHTHSLGVLVQHLIVSRQSVYLCRQDADSLGIVLVLSHFLLQLPRFLLVRRDSCEVSIQLSHQVSYSESINGLLRFETVDLFQQYYDLAVLLFQSRLHVVNPLLHLSIVFGLNTTAFALTAFHFRTEDYHLKCQLHRKRFLFVVS